MIYSQTISKNIIKFQVLTGIPQGSIINFLKMNRLLISILIVVLAYSQVHMRLNTKQTKRLMVDESIISTMGLFKATLRKTNCSLEIMSFNQTTYVSKGKYQSPLTSSDCEYLQIKEGKIFTSGAADWMVVGSSFNDSTIFTIDDLGVLRLIGTYIKFNRVDQESFQQNVTTFLTEQKYLTAATQLNVKFTSSYGPLVNERNWIYLAEFGQLDIYDGNDPSRVKNYVYSRFKFNNSQIQDFNSDTFPAAIFPDIKFPPRCFEPRIYINFKAPFVIQADPYWPRVVVREQGGYKILQVNYGQKSEYNFQQDQVHINSHREFSVCPDQTFQHKGQCLAECPQPYYHQMRGKRGSCLLVCEEHTPKNQEKRICSCLGKYEADHFNTEYIKQCPANTKPYPYGCFCTGTNQYFDRKLTFACVSTCPQTTFAHEGICVDCPENCKTCQKDSFFRMFLQCTVCQSGYELRDGQCFKSCNSNLGKSLVNNVCEACNDTNCVDCSGDKNTCKKCGLLFALSNGICVSKCPTNSTQVASQFFSTKCLPKPNETCTAQLSTHYKQQAFLKCDQCDSNLIAHLSGCVATCPSGYKKYQYEGFSYCVCQNGLTINDQCVDLPGCPIKMTYDLYSGSCLSCPFGCASCVGSTCTSCNPGYFLYVSPQAVLCRRDSPLFACDQQYALTNGVCLVQDYANLQMTKCRANIPNCLVCPFQRDNVCVMCRQGFLQYNNTCVAQCPTKHIPYQNLACLLTEIQNCVEHHLESIRQATIVNITYIQKNDPYKYYIFNNLEPANDPVGYIPYFQKITSSRRVTDGLFRQSAFFQSRWTCLKCSQGYGLSQNFKSCLPCVSPCVNCYMAKNNSCINDDDIINPNNCQGYVEFSSKKCIKSCNQTNSFPVLESGVLFCKTDLQTSVSDVMRIDSAIYQQNDGSKITYFIFQNEIPVQGNATVRIESESRRRRLQQSNSTTFQERVVQLKDKNYIEVLAAPDQDVFVVNFTNSIRDFQSVEGYLPPNLVYGSTTANTHPEFMKTWLAYIGYIMSIVIIMMHCIYIGNQLLYKMDNLLIMVQTIYFFSFVKILVGRLLAQFYYGWFFAHIGFFPNFFTTPDQYRENEAPISYKLATTDANFIRNAGFSISFFLVYIGCLGLVTGVVYLLYRFLHKKQIWYPRVALLALLGGIELLSLNIFYWAIAHILYRQECQNCDSSYHKASLAWSIVFIVLICLYTIGRFFFNAIGGLYMVKRILIATILAGAFDDLLFMIPFLIMEIIFTVLRFTIQRPETKKEKIFILVQFGISLLVYLLLFLCTNAGVNTIIISIVIFIFIVSLMSDFVKVFLESANQWDAEPENRHSYVKSEIERANTDTQIIHQNTPSNRY